MQGRGERVGTFSVAKGQVLCAPSIGVDGGTRRDTDDPASARNSRDFKKQAARKGEQVSKSSPSPTLARPGGRKAGAAWQTNEGHQREAGRHKGPGETKN